MAVLVIDILAGRILRSKEVNKEQRKTRSEARQRSFMKVKHAGQCPPNFVIDNKKTIASCINFIFVDGGQI